MRIVSVIAVAIAILLLSLIASFNQIKARGLSWQEVHYRAEIEQDIQGGSTEPTGLKVLASYITWGTYRAVEFGGVPRPFGVALVLISISFNAALLAIALYFYQRLGIPVYLGLFGISATTWGMTQGNMTSTLAFDRSIETIVFLLVALALLGRRDALLVPLVLLAALNRDSALMIAPVYLAARWDAIRVPGGVGVPMRIFGGALVLFLIAFVSFVLGHFETAASGVSGINALSTFLLIAGPLPILAMISLSAWPPVYRRMAITLIVIWGIYLLFQFEGQGNLLLLPMSLVFVPGTLLTLCAARGLRTTPEPAHAL